MTQPYAPLTCEPNCIPSPGLEPPRPRLVHIPALRICACGRVLRREERAQDCCDVCLVLNRHLPQLPVYPASAISQGARP